MTNQVNARALTLIFYLFFFCLLLVNIKVHNQANSASRMATIESLVDHGTYKIDQSGYSWTIDKVKKDGHFYSSKPPMLSTILSIPYFLLKSATGITFKKNPKLVTYYINLLGAGLPFFLMVLLVLSTLRSQLNEIEQLAVLVIFTSSTLMLGYATSLNNHIPAALMLLLGYIRLKGSTQYLGKMALTGVFLGLAITFDLPSLAIVGALVLSQLVRGSLKNSVALLFGVGMPVLLALFLQWMATGSILPTYLQGSLADYPGGYFNNPVGLDALSEPFWIYLFHLTIGHHGLVSMTPILLIGLIELVRRAREKRISTDAFLVLAFLAIFTFYPIFTNNYGGLCVGPRWFIPFYPMLFVLIPAEFWRRNLLNYNRWFFLAYLVGCFNTMNALMSPWQNSLWHTFLAKFGLGSIAIL